MKAKAKYYIFSPIQLALFKEMISDNCSAPLNQMATRPWNKKYLTATSPKPIAHMINDNGYTKLIWIV